jgi:hypothetical protein
MSLVKQIEKAIEQHKNDQNWYNYVSTYETYERDYNILKSLAKRFKLGDIVTSGNSNNKYVIISKNANGAMKVAPILGSGNLSAKIFPMYPTGEWKMEQEYLNHKMMGEPLTINDKAKKIRNEGARFRKKVKGHLLCNVGGGIELLTIDTMEKLFSKPVYVPKYCVGRSWYLYKPISYQKLIEEGGWVRVEVKKENIEREQWDSDKQKQVKTPFVRYEFYYGKELIFNIEITKEGKSNYYNSLSVSYLKCFSYEPITI